MASSSSVTLSLKHTSYAPSTLLPRTNSTLTFFTETGDVLKKIEFEKAVEGDPHYLGKGAFGTVRGSKKDSSYVVKNGPLIALADMETFYREKHYANRMFGTPDEPAAEIYYFIVGDQKRLSLEEVQSAFNRGRNIHYRQVQIRHHGMNLKAALDNVINDPIKTLLLLIQTAEALRSCHSIYRMIHGDPTSNNFIVIDSPEGSIVRPVDFGWTYDRREITGERAKATTTHQKCSYWSLDRTQNKKTDRKVCADTRQDVFSLGYIIKKAAARLPLSSNIAIRLEALSSRMLSSKTTDRIYLKEALNSLKQLFQQELDQNLPHDEVAKKTEQERRAELIRRAELGRKLELERQAEQAKLRSRAKLTEPAEREGKLEARPSIPVKSEEKYKAIPSILIRSERSFGIKQAKEVKHEAKLTKLIEEIDSSAKFNDACHNLKINPDHFNTPDKIDNAYKAGLITLKTMLHLKLVSPSSDAEPIPIIQLTEGLGGYAAATKGFFRRSETQTITDLTVLHTLARKLCRPTIPLSLLEDIVKLSTERKSVFRQGPYKNERLTLFSPEPIKDENLSLTEKTIRYVALGQFVPGFSPKLIGA